MKTAWPVRRAAGSASCVSHGSVAKMNVPTVDRALLPLWC